jgi:hypothetical protein
MTRPDPKNNDAAAMTAETLLVHYSFDLSHWTAAELIHKWLDDYPARWLRLAIIEALYQGRYKSISVEQILACWQRRSRPIYHFNLEFEQLICGKLPEANIPEQDVNVIHQSALFDPEELAENVDSMIEATDSLLTNNAAIAPMIAKYKPDLSQPTTEENVPIIIEDTAEPCPEVALLSATENSENYSENYSENFGDNSGIVSPDIDSNLKNYLPLIYDNPAAKADEKEKLSTEEIHRQIINDLLQDPWLDEEDEAAIQSILNISINSSIDDSINGANGAIAASISSADLAKFDLETVLNLDSEQSPSDQGNSEDNWQERRPPIHKFTPDVAASEFYMKLKAVLENKLQHPEEEPRKRRRRGNRV